MQYQEGQIWDVKGYEEYLFIKYTQGKFEIWRKRSEVIARARNGSLYSRVYKEHKCKEWKSSSGYICITISINSRKKILLPHVLIAETLIPNPKSLPVVNHIDGDKTNYHVNNLEWVTYSENTNHAVHLGLCPSLFTQEEVIYYRSIYKPYQKPYDLKSLSKQSGRSEDTMGRMLRNKTWYDPNYIPPETRRFTKSQQIIDIINLKGYILSSELEELKIGKYLIDHLRKQGYKIKHKHIIWGKVGAYYIQDNIVLPTREEIINGNIYNK